ncbi:trypsin-like peptidase domain-containing protein [Candidatus Poribacteria bacterium]|nr:trypsin-like peptidase domain-containing protein [Candidatus Poribacteria bacterium]
MQKIVFFFLTIFVFFQCGFVFAQDMEQTQNAIVRLIADQNQTGVGCIIKVDEETRTAYILTAYHVIKGFDEVKLQFYIGGHPVEEAIAQVNSQWTDQREEKDFAVISVKNYPESLSLPVIFIDDFSEEKTSDLVSTSGYDEASFPISASGNISSLDPVLRYGATIVRPGFSGGPVFSQEGFMIGMNLELDKPNREIYAVRANIFKPVVDKWIGGLPRMQLALSIDGPAGAKDGIVSTGQAFTIKASVKEDKRGNLVGPKVKLTLKVPEGYQIEGLETMTVSLRNERLWAVKAPDEPKAGHYITVNTSPEANPPLEPIRITTVKVATLEIDLIKPPQGLTLFVADEQDVRAVVKNRGDAKLAESGTLKIEFQPNEFDRVEGRIEEPFVVDQPVNWKLRAKSETTSGHIAVTIAPPGKDENGMSPKVIDSLNSTSIKVKDVPRWRSYIGFPAVSFREEKMAVEAELGTRVRGLKLFRRGIPLYIVMSGVFGIDDIIGGIDRAQAEDEVAPVFDQLHTLATLSLAIPLGRIISWQGGVGGSFYFGDENFNAGHLATGIELSLGQFSIQGGIRHVFNDSELGGLSYSVQIRFPGFH